ncbi:alpha/beta fold hydrolase [Desulfovibrionales bacterium]
MRTTTQGCLLLHGYAGRPFEMQGIAERLEQAGLTTAVPTLAGHTGNEAEFAASRFTDWQASAEQAFLALRARVERIFVLGFSLGGSLALDLAQRHQVDGLITLATPVFLHRLYPFWTPDWRLFFTGFLRSICPRMPMPPVRPESRAIAPWHGYEQVHYVRTLHSLKQGILQVGRGLHHVTAPLLVIHALQDRAVHVDNAWHIARAVRSARREVRLLSVEETITSRHMLVTHRDTWETVAAASCAFVQSLTSGSH